MHGAVIRSNMVFFLFLHKNLHCRYSLEASQQQISNEYPHNILYHEDKIYILFELKKNVLSGAMVLKK